jgi:hypothetical protein
MLKFVHNRIDLHAVTRGEQESFLDTGIRAEAAQRFSEPAFRHGKPLPNLDRRRLMADPYNDNMHVRNLLRGLSI